MDIRTERIGPAHSLGMTLLWRELRKRGWSQNELARELGVTKGLVTRWLHGDRRPGLRNALALEEMFGIDAASWTEAMPRSFALTLSKDAG